MSLRKVAVLVCASFLILAAVGCSEGSDKDDDGPRTLLEFVGRIDQDGERFNFYGYVAHVDGVEDSVLFTSQSTHNETTARLILSTRATMTGRAILENIFSVDASGDIGFYFNEAGGAKIDDPTSFTRGTKAGGAAAKFHNIITVIAPNQGLSQGTGDLTFAEALTIKYSGKSYTIVPKGTNARIFATGSGTRLEPVAPRATILVSGDIVANGK
ncbi:MAG TPA: hypothetical protein VJB57_16520 [Dehalococcoidia bacterium]|nr:hypothetical protein [Dehalococcoidia bacterium]